MVALATISSACSDEATSSSTNGSTATTSSPQRFPDVVDATAEFDPSTDTWSFTVTISSPYDSPTRYADGWQILGPDRSVYGVHTLAHDHAGEQPFTRQQRGVEIPDGIDVVTIEGRDQANGFGGDTFTVELHPQTDPTND